MKKLAANKEGDEVESTFWLRSGREEIRRKPGGGDGSDLVMSDIPPLEKCQMNRGYLLISSTLNEGDALLNFFVIWKVGDRESRFMCFIHTQGRAGIITTYYSVIVTSHSLTSARVTHVPMQASNLHCYYYIFCMLTNMPATFLQIEFTDTHMHQIYMYQPTQLHVNYSAAST